MREPARRRLGVLSRWGSACGMDEYVREFVEQVGPDFDVVIFASRESAPLETPGASVLRDWDAHREDARQLLDDLGSQRIDCLYVQFNWGFVPVWAMNAAAAWAHRVGTPVAVELHATRQSAGDDSLQDISATLSVAGLLLVHGEHDYRRLDAAGYESKTWLFPLPHPERIPADRESAAARLGVDGRRPVLATFGFLQPRKNILELIRAVDVIRRVYPQALMIACNALHPRDVDADYYLDCVAEIARLDLRRHFYLLVDFLPESSILNVLHAADLIVLPYRGTYEGASAAASFAISAGRPLIVSGAPLFDSLGGAAVRLRETSADEIAETCLSVIEDGPRLEALRCASAALAEETSWARVTPSLAERIMQLIKDTSLPEE